MSTIAFVSSVEMADEHKRETGPRNSLWIIPGMKLAGSGEAPVAQEQF